MLYTITKDACDELTEDLTQLTIMHSKQLCGSACEIFSYIDGEYKEYPTEGFPVFFRSTKLDAGTLRTSAVRSVTKEGNTLIIKTKNSTYRATEVAQSGVSDG